MVLIAGLKSMRAGSGIMNGFKYLFKVILYSVTKCLPAISNLYSIILLIIFVINMLIIYILVKLYQLCLALLIKWQLL